MNLWEWIVSLFINPEAEEVRMSGESTQAELSATEKVLIEEQVKKVMAPVIEDAAVKKVEEVAEQMVPAVVAEKVDPVVTAKVAQKADEIVPQKVAIEAAVVVPARVSDEVADQVPQVAQKVALDVVERQGPKLRPDAGAERPGLDNGPLDVQPVIIPGEDKPGIQAFSEINSLAARRQQLSDMIAGKNQRIQDIREDMQRKMTGLEKEIAGHQQEIDAMPAKVENLLDRVNAREDEVRNQFGLAIPARVDATS